MANLHHKFEDRSSFVAPGPSLLDKVDDNAAYQVFIAGFAHQGLIREAVKVLRIYYSECEEADGVIAIIVAHHMVQELN